MNANKKGINYLMHFLDIKDQRSINIKVLRRYGVARYYKLKYYLDQAQFQTFPTIEFLMADV
jgi:hypothetical protein